MKDFLMFINIIIGIIGVIGGAIATRIALPSFAVLFVLQLVEVINIGWMMVFAYPLMLLFGGLLCLGISMLWTAFFASEIK